LNDALRAYAAGFEAMASLAEASHPALYDAGWHPTTVCGPVGAAVAACSVLGLSDEQRRTAIALSLLRAGGTRGAFGSDGKAIQVGLAGAAGVQAALAAQSGAVVDFEAAVTEPLGFLAVTGASWPAAGAAIDAAGVSAPGVSAPGLSASAISRNWLKLHPSCLGTHAPIDCAIEAAEAGLELHSDSIEVVVHPVARQAAHVETVTGPLSAKFSIAYCVAFTLLHGAPTVADFYTVDDAALSASSLVSLRVDPELADWGAALIEGGRSLTSVPCPRGAPGRPLSDDELADKVRSLAGERLLDAVADLDAPASYAWESAGLPASSGFGPVRSTSSD
jgi:2-methylcitrate dehydratase PrpD